MRHLARLRLRTVIAFTAGWALFVVAFPTLVTYGFYIWVRIEDSLGRSGGFAAFNARWTSSLAESTIILIPPLALLAIRWVSRIGRPSALPDER